MYVLLYARLNTRRLNMIYANVELKYAECDYCGQEKKCFIQYELDEEHVVCPQCLLSEDSDSSL